MHAQLFAVVNAAAASAVDASNVVDAAGVFAVVEPSVVAPVLALEFGPDPNRRCQFAARDGHQICRACIHVADQLSGPGLVDCFGRIAFGRAVAPQLALGISPHSGRCRLVTIRRAQTALWALTMQQFTKSSPNRLKIKGGRERDVFETSHG